MEVTVANTAAAGQGEAIDGMDTPAEQQGQARTHSQAAAEAEAGEGGKSAEERLVDGIEREDVAGGGEAAEGVAKSGGESDEERNRTGGGVESNEDEVDEKKSTGVSDEVGSGAGVEESVEERIDRNESGEAAYEVGEGIAGEELMEERKIDCKEMNVSVGEVREEGEINEAVERMGTDEAVGEGENKQMEADGVAEDEEGGGTENNGSVEEQKESIELRELTPEVEERVLAENAMDEQREGMRTGELSPGERGVIESEESMEGEESGRMETDEPIPMNANQRVGMENIGYLEDEMREKIKQDEALEEDLAEELINAMDCEVRVEEERGVEKMELPEEMGKGSLSGFVEPQSTKLLFSPIEVAVKEEEMEIVEEVKKEEHYNDEAIGTEEMVRKRVRTEMKVKPHEEEEEEKEEEGLPPLQSVEPSPSPPIGKVKEEVGEEDVKMKTEEEVIGEEEGPPPGYQLPLTEPALVPSPAKSQSPKRPLVSDQLHPAVLEAPRPPLTPTAPSYEMAQMVCGSCRRLLSYIRGARYVQCSCCQTVNFVLEEHQVGQVKCNSCAVLLMYPYGAPSVKCSSCQSVTEIGDHNKRPRWSVQQGRAPPGTVA